MPRPKPDFPEGFTARSEDRYGAALDRVEALYWWTWGKDNRYHSRSDTDEYRRLAAEREALLWAGGYTPFPPGCSVPVPRTRANLLLLAAMMELNLRGTGEEWEDRARGGRNFVDEYVDSQVSAGALAAYTMLLRDTWKMPHDLMLPEQLRPIIDQARTYYREAMAEQQGQRAA